MLPKFSIVTPSYNQRSFLEAALESVRSQRYPRLEHIVIDGASSDGTREYLESLAGQPGWSHLHWKSEPDNGQSDALNKGFKLASGDIIGWLNSDDVYRVGCFDAVVEGFRNKSVDILYGDTTWIDETGRLLQRRREIQFSPFVMRYHRVLCVPTAASFFARRIFDDDNFLDTQYRYAMDLEFFLRLESRGYRFCHIPVLLADFRWHKDSKSSGSAAKQFEERDKILPLYSRVVGKLPWSVMNRSLLYFLRCAAGFRYWGEKFARGFYFERMLFPSNQDKLEQA